MEIVGFGEFHPKQPNETPEGRNANRRVSILVLEEVQPANQPPAPGVQTVRAEAGSAGGEMAGPADGASSTAGASGGDAGQTTLTNPQAKITQRPAQHIGPTELIWPGSASSDSKPPPAAAHHE
jgi:hypothetical protein